MSEPFFLTGRSSGVLLHPTSLPGPGIGDLGAPSHHFVDWLVEAGQRYWQILPLVPVDSGGSPYNGLSALAGNPLLLSPFQMLQDGLVEASELAAGDELPRDRVDYSAVLEWKDHLLLAAFRRFSAGAASHLREPFEQFRDECSGWVEDYGMFRALREHHRGAPWIEWPADIRRRELSALERWRQLLSNEIERFAFQQFLFDRQWSRLRTHARERGIRIIGDLPIFVAHDSADVWAHPELFQLDESGRPTHVSGVPPDYFSETGQRWGNPLYRWGKLREQNYSWWVERFRRTFAFVDVVRVDHFRGFEAYWEIPADEETAVHGQWVEGPGVEFFRAVEQQLGKLPIIAEDLGLITDEVDALREELGFPGMRVIQFAFDGDPANVHLPANYTAASVAYTGTHDNDTIEGWWATAEKDERRRARHSLGEDELEPWDFVRAVFASPADLAIVPLQDLLGLPSAARMNTPGRPADNWTWRIGPHQPDHALAARLRELTRRTDRLSPSSERVSA